MSWVGGDAGKDIGQPGLRIDAVHFGRDDQAVHRCGASPSAIRLAEQRRLSSFRGIVGQTHASVLQERREASPSLQDVVERFSQVMSAGELGGKRQAVTVQAL